MATNSKRNFLYIGAVLIAGGIAIWCLLFRRPRVPEVDLRVVSDPGVVPENDERFVLRVAIGAMISPRITKRYYEDLMRLVGDKVGMRIALIQRKTYAEVNSLIENRKIDLAFVCSGPYVQGHDKYGLEIIAVPVVGGEKVYFCYVIANANSKIRTFDQLRGTRFAFTDPDSNTGSLVPKYMLAKLGETPETFFRETFFTYSHDNSIRAVADGLADGAAVDSLIWEFMRATDPGSVSKTIVVKKSSPYGIPPIVVHPALDPGLKAKLKAVLLSLHEDPEARKFLDLVRIDRFEEGNDALYDSVRGMETWLTEKK